ncbi:MAG: NAD(P)H-dependent oxidoreductase [Ruminococcus sp.]|nr:NAD(P)H-dependent oxidoreductase [Ruminococcus sp.]
MSRTLTVYFSPGGNTAKLAKAVAKVSESELFEIKPRDPYTPGDIKWTNPLARCNKEKLGKKDVPIEGTVENFGDFDTVFIGFPIWYYGAPNIISTFVKSYSWEGKKVALFATSGGSDIGRTAEKLLPCFNGNGEIKAAKVFRPSENGEAVRTWVMGIL